MRSTRPFNQRKPLLTYFYTPHWVHRKYDLTEVQLPAFDEECEEAARERDGEGYDCDYANDVLFKAVSRCGSRTRRRRPSSLLKKFKYTTDDQQEIAFLTSTREACRSANGRRPMDRRTTRRLAGMA